MLTPRKKRKNRTSTVHNVLYLWLIEYVTWHECPPTNIYVSLRGYTGPNPHLSQGSTEVMVKVDVTCVRYAVPEGVMATWHARCIVAMDKRRWSNAAVTLVQYRRLWTSVTPVLDYMHTASLGRWDWLISAQVCIFSYEYVSETVKSNCELKRMEEMGCSRTRDFGFHYETYDEISSSQTLLKTLHFLAWFCRFRQIFVPENTHCIVGTAIWAHLTTSSPRLKSRAWCGEISPSCLPNDAVCM